MAERYSPVRVYVSSSWSNRKEALRVAQELMLSGATITSSWLTVESTTGNVNALLLPDRHEGCRQRAMQDLRDIDDCDVFVLLNPKRLHLSGHGGRHVETGYAIAKGKPIFILGARENVFHYTFFVHSVCKDVKSLLKALNLYDAGRRKRGGH